MTTSDTKTTTTVREFANQAMLPGIREFFVPRWYWKLLWFLFYSMSIGFGIGVISFATEEYFQEPTGTVTRNDAPLDKFPAIAVCPILFYDQEKLNEQNLTHLVPYLDNLGINDGDASLDWNVFWRELEMRNISSMSNFMRMVALKPEQYLPFDVFSIRRLNPRQDVKSGGVCSIIDEYKFFDDKFEDYTNPTLIFRKEMSNPKLTFSVGPRATSKLMLKDFQMTDGFNQKVYIKVTIFQTIRTKNRQCVDKKDQSYDEKFGLCNARCQNRVIRDCWECKNASAKPGDSNCLICQRFLGDDADEKGVFYMKLGPGDMDRCANNVSKDANDVRGCVLLSRTSCGHCKAACVEQQVETTVFLEPYDYTRTTFFLLNHKSSIMITEAHSYSLSSLFSNIGGALGMVSGLKLITIFQIIFFCCRRKARNE